MTDLSPQAQAVLDAVTAQLEWDAHYHSHSAAAAALRAVANEVVPESNRYVSCLHEPVKAELQHVRDRILAIANELDS